MRKRLILIGMAAVIGLLGTSCSNDDPAIKTGASTANAEHADADVMFAQQMIPHHEEAVRMAQLATDRAADPQVKDLATRIETAQAPEITKMKGWLDDWGMVPAMSGMQGMAGESGAGSGMMGQDEVESLEAASGPAFDRLFLEGMIKHHQGAVVMASAQIDNGQSRDAVALAKMVKSGQEAEIAEMQGLLDRLM